MGKNERKKEHTHCAMLTWSLSERLNPHTQLHFCRNHGNFLDALKFAFAQYTKFSKNFLFFKILVN